MTGLKHKIDIKVMAVEARKEPAEQLARKLNAKVVYDDRGISGGGDAWYNAKRCWQSEIGPEYTHRLVIQEDAIIRDDFVERAYDCIRFRPDPIWAFYLQPNLQRLIRPEASTPYIRVWGAAICGIAIIIPSYIRYSNIIEETDMFFGRDYKHDDNRLAWYINKNNLECYTTCPALVSHSILLKSVSKHNAKRYNLLYSENAEANWSADFAVNSPLFMPYFWLKKTDRYFERGRRYTAIARQEAGERYAESVKAKAKLETRG